MSQREDINKMKTSITGAEVSRMCEQYRGDIWPPRYRLYVAMVHHSATIGIEIQQELPYVPWSDGKGIETGRRMARIWQSDTIHGLHACWQDGLTAILTLKPTQTPDHHHPK